MFERPDYIAELNRSLGTPLIKVLTGIRRCGKSSLLQLIRASLLAAGHPLDRVLLVNMESMEFDTLRDHRELYRFVKAKLPQGGYFLFDEAQEVPGWERVLTSLLAEGSIECVITGSNASLLSSELGTLLTGRFVEIPVHPLSFPEFKRFSTQPKGDPLSRYLRVGGFPAIHRLVDEDAVLGYLSALLDSILLRDVVKRHAIRDPDGLSRILAYALDNVGNLTAARRVSEFFKSQRRTISTDTVANYLGFLCDAFVLHRVRRYDIKGKQHLEHAEKFYAGDVGLRHGLIGHRDRDIAGVLENAVFLELRRRGYRTSVGVIGQGEVDFVAERREARRYFQVCTELRAEGTIERELRSLEAIDDHWPKAIIVRHEADLRERNGIRVIPLEAFLDGAD